MLRSLRSLRPGRCEGHIWGRGDTHTTHDAATRETTTHLERSGRLGRIEGNEERERDGWPATDGLTDAGRESGRETTGNEGKTRIGKIHDSVVGKSVCLSVSPYTFRETDGE